MMWCRRTTEEARTPVGPPQRKGAATVHQTAFYGVLRGGVAEVSTVYAHLYGVSTQQQQLIAVKTMEPRTRRRSTFARLRVANTLKSLDGP